MRGEELGAVEIGGIELMSQAQFWNRVDWTGEAYERRAKEEAGFEPTWALLQRLTEKRLGGRWAILGKKAERFLEELV